MQWRWQWSGRLLAAALAGLVAAGALAAPPTGRSIDASVRRAMEVFDVPGMAVSVVVDGKVFHSAGYGILEAGSRKRVDNRVDNRVDKRTLFQIGSVSKAFTAAALAVLADEGKLDWDDRVIDHLPEFRMVDPWVTREFTIRDLLTHRSGLPLGAGDLLIFPDGNATPGDVIRALRYLKPATSFRSQFAYDNLMYIVAGEVVARTAGVPFAQFVEQRLLAPLGMRDCVASPDRVPAGAVQATPHVLVDGALETTTTRVSPLVAAAGGITCNARGMASWMSFLLNRGKTADGRQLVSEAQFAELVRPVTLLPASGYMAEHAGTYLSAYALGWDVSTFYGQPMWSHSGGVWGMTTFIAVMPEQRLAVFATDNQLTAAPRAVVYEIIDRFLRDKAADAGDDWIAIIDGLRKDRGAAAEDAVAKARSARDAESSPSLPLERYAGTYSDPWYGDVHLSVKDGGLWFRSDRNAPLEGPLEHFQYDTFVARWTDRRLMADAYVTFSLNADGSVRGIRMKAVSPATDFSFDFHDLDLERVP